LKKKISKVKAKAPIKKQVAKIVHKPITHKPISIKHIPVKHASIKHVEHIPLRPKLEPIHIKHSRLTRAQKWLISGIIFFVVLIIVLAFLIPADTFTNQTPNDQNTPINPIDNNTVTVSDPNRVMTIEEFQNVSLDLQRRIYNQIKAEQQKIIEPHYQELGLNSQQINSCITLNDFTRTDVNVENSKILLKIQKDTYIAPILGVSQAPGIFVNGYYLSGEQTYVQVKEKIDFALLDTPITWNYDNNNYTSNMSANPTVTIIYNEDHEVIKNNTLEFINYLKTSESLTPELRAFFTNLFKEVPVNYYSYTSTKGINLIEALDIQVIPVIYIEGDISKSNVISDVNNNELFTYLFLRTDAGGYILNQKIAYDILVTSKINSVHQIIDYSLIGDVDDYVIGNKDTKVAVYLFSNYDCPACASFETNSLDKLMVDYVNTNKIKIIKKDFIVSEMSGLYPAIFSRCAQEQNKYLETNKLLFDLSTELGTDGVVKTIIANNQAEIDILTNEYQKIITAQQK